jgi:hypothetical protein
VDRPLACQIGHRLRVARGMASGRGTLHPLCAAGYFVDPVSGDRLDDADKIDAYGQELIGLDDDGFWWGTERAAWVLHEHAFTVTVHGKIGRRAWEGHFVGTEAAAVDYAETHGVDVDDVESGDPAYEQHELYRLRRGLSAIATLDRVLVGAHVSGAHSVRDDDCPICRGELTR